MFFYRMVVEYYFTAKFAAHCTLLQELTLVGFGSGPWNTGLKQSVSPLKMKKKKGPWINPPHICSRFWIKTIPRFIWLPEKREKRRRKKSFCVCGKISHLQYLKLPGNYLECTLEKHNFLLRFTVSAAYVCQPSALCPHCAQSWDCSTWDVLKPAFI